MAMRRPFLNGAGGEAAEVRAKPRAATRDEVARGAREWVDEACRRVVAGRLAARDVGRWVSGFGVGEAEFRLLWLLEAAGGVSDAASGGASVVPLDQADIAALLAVSPAQVSALVERLRGQGLIEHDAGSGDRRRQTWRLADGGRALVAAVISAVGAAPRASVDERVSSGEAA